jgi:uroporphyrinogen-III decarboxylase
MNSKERALKALYIEEADMIPIWETRIDLPHMETITGKKFTGEFSAQTQVSSDRRMEVAKVEFTVECYKKLKFDVIRSELSAPDGWKPLRNPDGTIVDEWGRVLIYDAKCKIYIPYSSIIKTPEDFENLSYPDPNAPGRTFAIEYTKKIVGDDMALAAFIRDPFAHAWEMFTPMNFVRWMYEKPQLVRKAIEKLTEFNIELIKHIGDIGVDFIMSGGDYCEKNGPMVPLKFFREIIFPNLKKQVEAAHKRGLKFIKHTDGNINPMLDDLANIVDGLHSLDPTASVDIGEVKAKYGDKLILMGNVAVDSLARKSKKEVIEETKECIKKASPGGGHFLSSSNTWYVDAKLENCIAMVKTGRKYGKYPISI